MKDDMLYRCLLVLGMCAACALTARVKKVHHLEDRKFASEEYLDPEIDERDSGPEPPISPLDQPLYKKVNSPFTTAASISQKIDPNIKWDPGWAANHEFGQISAVSIDPNGNIGIFHRGERIWDSATFGKDNKFNTNKGPIRQSTILLLDKTGNKLIEWGRSMFYLPHGLTIDSLGNYWITDVAMHQVFKFDAEDIEKHKQQLNSQKYSQKAVSTETFDINNLFGNSILKPSLILGEAFQPGNDNTRFCKPTAVAVQANGDFFVSDGYCNSRVIKFNKNGERISQWGRTWGFADHSKALYDKKPPPQNALLVPHALTLAEDHSYIFVADRENGRVVCCHASNGSFYKEYKSPILGGAIYSIAYANDRIYLVNGHQIFENTHVRGFILDINTGEVLSQFTPGMMDMNNPHDIAVTADEREIYVVELNSHRVYKFYQDIKGIKSLPKLIQSNNSTEAHSAALAENTVTEKSKKPSQKILILSAIIAALFFIGFCIFLAALLARYQKRGRNFRYDEEPNVEFHKLVGE